MGPMRNPIVTLHGATETTLATRGSAELNPAVVYLGRLSIGSRPAVRSVLTLLARIAAPDSDGLSFPWPRLRYEHTQAIRAALVTRFETRSVNRALSVLRSVLKEAWRLQLMTTDDYMRAVDVRSLPNDGTKAGRSLSPAELGELVAACNAIPPPAGPRNRAIIALLYAAGLRRAEIAKLDVGDFDPATGATTVRKGKRNKTRTAYVASEWIPYVASWVKDAPPGPLAPRLNQHGITKARLSANGVGEIVEEIRELAGVAAFTPHDLRRSFASHILDAGGDLSMLKDLMGHEDIATTAIYDRRGEASKIQEVARIRLPKSLTVEKGTNK